MSPDATERAASLQTVRQYQSAIAELREGPEPRSARLTIHVLAAMVLAFVLVLIFGHTDRIVSSEHGQFVTSLPETVIQAFDASIIKTIDVREGEEVKKGQLLASLDSTLASSTVDQLRSQINQLTAQLVRTHAEIAGSPLVIPDSDDPDFVRAAKIQKDLYDQQIAQYKAQLVSFDQKIAVAKTTIAKYEADLKRLQERKDIAQQVEDMRSTLEQHGTGSLLNRLMSSDSRIEAERQSELDRNSIEESSHSLASLQADREVATQQFLTAASQELATAQTNLGAAKAQLDAATLHKNLVRILASDDSIVLSIAKLSVGSVLQPGLTLMTLTPTSVPVVAEISISPRDVAFIRPGDLATLKIDAFNVAEHGFVDGKVLWVSEDAFGAPTTQGAAETNSTATQQPQEVYYKARISIDQMKLINVPANVRLMPGMTLTADIKVGRRSLGAYLLGTMLHGAGTAMREP